MGLFDNAESVFINNKEVQSIVTSNGGVIYEKPAGYLLTLTGDKSIIQTGELCTLTATLTRNNVPVSGETIIFYDADYTPLTNPGEGAYNPQYSLGNSFSLYYASKGGTHIYIESNDLTIAVDRNGLVRMTDDNHSWTTLWTSKTSLNLRNGVLSDDEGHSYDISSYNNNFTLTTIYGAGSVYLEFYGVAITNVNGVATVGYTGKGTGDLNIQAYYLERIISSEIFVEDCIYYDNALSDNSSNYPKTSNLSISHSTDHYILTASTNNQMMELGSDYDNVRYEILMSGTSHFARGLYYSDAQNEYETNSLYSIYQNNWNVNGVEMADITGGSWSLIKHTTYAMANDTYYKFIIEKNGTSITLKVETEDGTVIETQTVTKSLNSTHIGTLMYSGTAYVKDLKIKPL